MDKEKDGDGNASNKPLMERSGESLDLDVLDKQQFMVGDEDEDGYGSGAAVGDREGYEHRGSIRER